MGSIADHTTNGVNSGTQVDYDVIIVGAGFGGLRVLHEVRKLGLSVHLYEKGTGVGGTWYWNRYPGARTDSESWVYLYSYTEDIGLKFDYKERFPTQPQVEEYLNAVADHLDLRKDIQLNTRVASIHREPADNRWRVTAADGETNTCTFIISASGIFSVPLDSPYRNIESFTGEYYETGRWPKEKISFEGKRVAVIGTGATSVQVIPVVAHTAKEVTVFQRTANYVLPGRNHPLLEDELAEIHHSTEAIWKRARNQRFGLDSLDIDRTWKESLTPEEVNNILDYGWEVGAFRFVFETFSDLLVSEDSNKAAREFLKNKIRTVVKDPKTAELLCPDHIFLAKRPPIGHYYFEAYNRPNVKLVSIKDDPITEFTPKGLKQGGKEHEFDMIISAIGFDAFTGPLKAIDFRGEIEQPLGPFLEETRETLYGITVNGFPNAFLISGPTSPFANIPVITDNTSIWIGKAIKHILDHGYTRMDTPRKAALDWEKHVAEAADATMIGKHAREAGSWFIGANVEGKPQKPLLYFGGVPPYIKKCQDELDSNFASYHFS